MRQHRSRLTHRLVLSGVPRRWCSRIEATQAPERGLFVFSVGALATASDTSLMSGQDVRAGHQSGEVSLTGAG
jgi:hypothetical protein